MIKENFNKSKEQLEAKYLHQIEGNGYSRNQMIVNREMIKDLVESPLVPACEALYDKNILTLESSANSEDLNRGNVSIVIDYNSLSQENKQFVNEEFGVPIVSGDGISVVAIEIPVQRDTTIEEIIGQSLKKTERFKKQPLTWTTTYSLKEVVKSFTGEDDFGKYKPEDFSDHLYYDHKSQKFYLSKEHFDKMNE
jgi:hypothetical protein